ncbi:hypothetical protein CKA38_03230 [Ereboglobus luteus]|uniref:Uncharacterized protein n=2 Tax=Ereboglobus luteus TaxID=1796921 RepID=A0A2U8E0U4_9BACT|nr:hypothetical protein CKA38_03230 [Ereboglobus luteus]
MSQWESTALCLEAFLCVDGTEKKYKIIIESIVNNILKNKKWNISTTNDLSQDTCILDNVIMISVFLRMNNTYIENFLSTEDERKYYEYCQSVMHWLEEREDISKNQFCTIPQIMAYSLFATEDI